MLKIGPHSLISKFILAPMASVSQMPFRRLALKMGAGLAPTELISAKGLYHQNLRTKSYLAFDRKIERPFSVQLFGGEIDSMAAACEIAVAMGAQIIDINMGCPVKKVTKTNAGSALLCDYKRACEIVRAMLKRVNYKIPITVKIRSGWDNNNLNYLTVAKALEEAGISAIAIHARTRAQGYSGKADWAHIKNLKNYLTIPVIGNGDVNSLADAKNMLKETGCDAVMIGRASLGNPWIFKELKNNRPYFVSNEERLQTIIDHFDDHLNLLKLILEEERNQNKCYQLSALRSFRSHLIWYSKGLTNGTKFRERIVNSDCLNQTKDLMQGFFSTASLIKTNTNLPKEINYRQAFG